jgi:hypothetical protein
MSVLYKYVQFLQVSTDVAFDQVNSPGIAAPHSGIYRCDGCGRCITEVAGRPLPSQNHHQHSYQQGTIRWRLAACHSS